MIKESLLDKVEKNAVANANIRAHSLHIFV